jgi:hypothetical protein
MLLLMTVYIYTKTTNMLKQLNFSKKKTLLLVGGTLIMLQACKKEEPTPETPSSTNTSLDLSGTKWTSMDPTFVANERIMAIGSVNGEMILSFVDYIDPSTYYLSGQMTSSGVIQKHAMNYSGSGFGFEKIEVIGTEIYGLGSWNIYGLWKFDNNVFTTPAWNGWNGVGSYGTSIDAITKFGGERIEGYSSSPYVRSSTGNITFPNVEGSGIVINDMIVYNGNLIIAGRFSASNGVTLNNIAMWNGSGWEALGVGVNGVIYDLAILGDELIVGGTFTSAGANTNCQNIAKWNGTNWGAMGTGLQGGNNGVRRLFIYESQLFVGGEFDGAGTIASPNIIKWKNGNWIGLPNEITVPIGEIGVYNGHLYIANAFNIQGGNFLKKLE